MLDSEISNKEKISEGSEIELETNTEAEAEVESETNSDPYDPNLADVDKIIKRYESEDAAKELKVKTVGIPNDPRGGADKISSSSLAHNQESDNQYLREVIDQYSSAGKN